MRSWGGSEICGCAEMVLKGGGGWGGSGIARLKWLSMTGHVGAFESILEQSWVRCGLHDTHGRGGCNGE